MKTIIYLVIFVTMFWAGMATYWWFGGNFAPSLGLAVMVIFSTIYAGLSVLFIDIVRGFLYD